jgi:hypothetical protein
VGEGLRITVGPWELMEDFLAALDDTFPKLASRPRTTPAGDGRGGANRQGGTNRPGGAT